MQLSRKQQQFLGDTTIDTNGDAVQGKGKSSALTTPVTIRENTLWLAKGGAISQDLCVFEFPWLSAVTSKKTRNREVQRNGDRKIILPHAKGKLHPIWVG